MKSGHFAYFTCTGRPKIIFPLIRDFGIFSGLIAINLRKKVDDGEQIVAAIMPIQRKTKAEITEFFLMFLEDQFEKSRKKAKATKRPKLKLLIA
jgi:hypothetical protein